MKHFRNAETYICNKKYSVALALRHARPLFSASKCGWFLLHCPAAAIASDNSVILLYVLDMCVCVSMCARV